jgi:hypothetical protein
MRVVPLAFILCALMAPTAFAWCDLGVDDGIESARLGCSDSSCSTWCDSIFFPAYLHVNKPWELSIDCECKSSTCSCRVECDNDQGVTVVDTVTGIGRAVVSNCQWNVDCRLQLGRQASRDRATCNVLSYSDHGKYVFPTWAAIVIVVVILVAIIGGIVACCYCCCCRRPNSIAVVAVPQENPGTLVTVVSSTNTTMMHSPSYAYPPQPGYPPLAAYPPQPGTSGVYPPVVVEGQPTAGANEQVASPQPPAEGKDISV